jgi:hypothetical protein
MTIDVYAMPAEVESTLSSCAPALPDANALTATRKLSELLGLPLAGYDGATGQLLSQSAPAMLPIVPAALVREAAVRRSILVEDGSSGIACFAMPAACCNVDVLVVAGYVLTTPGARPAEFIVAAAERGWTNARIDAALRDIPYCEPRLLKRHLDSVRDLGARREGDAAERDDYVRMAAQLDSTYEEINLLHSLTQNMHLSRAPRDIAEFSLERLEGLIRAEGHAVWLDDPRDGRTFLIRGSIPFDEIGMARLLARFDHHDWRRPLVKNDLTRTAIAADFPRLRNFVITSIGDGRQRFGWLCSCNLHGSAEFGSLQSCLLSSVASILGTHQRNLELYRQHEDLLLCFVRSLVSTLDAKDPYTRGHSERVALIARRLGADLHLTESELHDVYLSGLLHDIGKIGVDDQILRKPGALTKEEFEQVKRHPVIGYNILVGLRNLQAVLPGVRHHHEAWSGKGYPDGLAGEAIPQMARILAVADSYDAMISDRPYREGMKREQLETILRRGAGEQWDPQVVAAYFASRDDIAKICQRHAQTSSSSAESEKGCSNTILPLETPSDVRAMLSVVAPRPLP